MEFIKRECRAELVTFTAATTSSTIGGAGFAGGTFTLPGSITGTSFGVQKGHRETNGTITWTDIYKTADDAAGTASIIAIAVAASRTFKIPDEVFGCEFWRFKSNGTETITLNIHRST